MDRFIGRELIHKCFPDMRLKSNMDRFIADDNLTYDQVVSKV